MPLISPYKYKHSITQECANLFPSACSPLIHYTDLPESAPVLEGAKTRYQLGERVTVNCTSFFSKPAATLEWRINDKLVVSKGMHGEEAGSGRC